MFSCLSYLMKFNTKPLFESGWVMDVVQQMTFYQMRSRNVGKTRNRE